MPSKIEEYANRDVTPIQTTKRGRQHHDGKCQRAIRIGGNCTYDVDYVSDMVEESAGVYLVGGHMC